MTKGTVISKVTMPTDIKNHLHSSSLNRLKNFPFRHIKYNEKFIPDRTIKIAITYSIKGEFQYATLSCLVEYPPVAVVVNE